MLIKQNFRMDMSVLFTSEYYLYLEIRGNTSNAASFSSDASLSM